MGPRLRLFTEALKLPSSDRSAFLIRSCGSDHDLLAQVKSLLSESNNTETSILGLRLRKSRQPTATQRRLRRPGSSSDPYARVRVPKRPLLPRRSTSIALDEPD